MYECSSYRTPGKKTIRVHTRIVTTFLAALAALPGAALYAQTWTTTADFNNGYKINAEGVTDALRIKTSPQVLPYIWVACTERRTVVRIATSDGNDPVTGNPITRGQVLGEYRVAPDNCDEAGAVRPSPRIER